MDCGHMTLQRMILISALQDTEVFMKAKNVLKPFSMVLRKNFATELLPMLPVRAIFKKQK
jgi:hypothetical protein